MNLFLILFLLFFNSGCANAKTVNAADNAVYLCGSGDGKRYHLTAHCRGLSNCSFKTVETTVEKAKTRGKTLCKWED